MNYHYLGSSCTVLHIIKSHFCLPPYRNLLALVLMVLHNSGIITFYKMEIQQASDVCKVQFVL